ncbi:MAG: rhodanese-like domain-containing protein [Cycloclasticus sp.]|nr:hypothetical protein A9Q80_06335 [Cycloclasticus sp. 46_83_sub15_T18]OUR83576.1 hypothetical protein A9Q82_02525 [Cycloclasticus sp. 46_120_T64]
MQHISVSELKQLIDSEQTTPLLLDVREPHEFECCRIEGSQLMPMQSVPGHLDQLDKEQAIVTICHHGMRSQQVAQFLVQNGFSNITNLSGGVDAWAQQVDLDMPRY